jgi:hypothetical protein
MPYSGGGAQDDYCRRQCKCRCGYYLAREKDHWDVPDFRHLDYVQPRESEVQYIRHGYPDEDEPRDEDGIIITGPRS